MLIFIGLSINVSAQEAVSSKFTNEFANPTIDYQKVVFVTLFLIVLIFIALYFIKKIRFNNLNDQGLVELIYSYPISTKDKLLIVKAAHEYLLLSSSGSGIRKLHLLDKEYMNDLQISNRPSANEFANIFVNIISKKDHA